MNRLTNKNAVITGGNSGIGLATAKEFIAEGASVIITGRNKEALDKSVQELGKNAHAVIADSADLTSIYTLKRKVSEIFPSIDILFVNAGISRFFPIEEVTEEVFDEVFNTNFKGAYFTIQQLLPLFKNGSSIILNASLNAHIGRPTASLYAATKGAVLTLAKNLSAELMPRKIRVNAISPGPIDTPLHTKKGSTTEEDIANRNKTKSMIPIGRFGSPEEIAKLVTFFASDEAPFVLGADIIVDGGMSL
ncbi:MAG: SDR family oxidoreductase [Bacteroidetes bacterium]|nr:SDR family oxidoreductase [Bacteroidota bacterium]